MNLLGTYGAFGRRAMLRIVRSPEVIISTAIFPLLLLLTLSAVFSSAVEGFEGGSYAQRLVPGLVVGGIIFGSIGTAMAVSTDLHSGYMSRIRSLPVPSSAPLIGTVGAEALRSLMAVLVLVGVGSLLGFRFEAGIVRGALFVLVAMLAAIALTCIGLAFATLTSGPEALGASLNMAFLVMLFLSESMVPLEAYPGWVEPLVQANPATSYVRLLDRLARGGELAGPATAVAAWSVVLIMGFGALAVRNVRRERR